MEKDQPKYVTVMPDYVDVTMNYSTFRTTVTVVLIILIILAAILMIYGINWVKNASSIQMRDDVNPYKITKNTTKISSIPIFFGVHDSPGSIPSSVPYNHIHDAANLTTLELCNNNDHAEWNNDDKTCSCKIPFWGRECERETYSTEFFAIGTVKPENFDYFISKIVDRQSFVQNLDQTTCDDLCRNEVKCTGYVIDPSTDEKLLCNLLDKIPEYKPDIIFDPNKDSNLFLKQTDYLGRPTLFNRVILFNGNLRPRFWLDNLVMTDHHKMTNIGIGVLNKLSFHPFEAVNDGKNIIVFSNDSFTYSDAIRAVRYYLNNGKQLENFHVHIPDKNNFSYPFSWNINNLWVMALSPKENFNIRSNDTKVKPVVVIYPQEKEIPAVGSPIKTLSEPCESERRFKDSDSSESTSCESTSHLKRPKPLINKRKKKNPKKPSNTESLSIFSGWSSE